MVGTDTHERMDSRQEAIERLRVALEQTNAELRDISSKIDTSRGQVDQLAQRNAIIFGDVRRIESMPAEMPQDGIVEVYKEALAIQQRLQTARGQVERLETEQQSVRQQAELLREVMQLLEQHAAVEAATEQADPREVIVSVIDAQEEQREQLARLMHDGPAHALTNFILQAEIVQKLFERDPDAAREELFALRKSAVDAFDRVRSFIFDLRPMMLTDLGLAPTIRRYLEAFEEKTGIKTEFHRVGRQERRLEHYREVMVFRGVQSLVQNARDHSAATAITVTLDLSGDPVVAVVEDNGRGFGTGRLNLDLANSEALGLGALQERVNLVGGVVRVDSYAGQGAKIRIEIPAGSSPAA